MNDHAGGGLPAARSSRGGEDRRRAPLPTRVGDLPRLPTEFRRALGEGAAALGLALPDEAVIAIEAHVRLLLAWNAAINLTAITEPSDVARRHVVDSLTALPLIAEAGGTGSGNALRLLDIGSGGGYPGIPILVLLPAMAGVLVDATAKKARFLEVAIDVAGLAGRASVAAVRAEVLAGDVGPGRGAPFDVVTARAVASLERLVELALPVLAVGGRLIAWKRGPIEAELEAGARAAGRLGGADPVIHAVPGDTGLDGHRLVVVEKRRPTPGPDRQESGRRPGRACRPDRPRRRDRTRW